jgi:DUF1009 family protein
MIAGQGGLPLNVAQVAHNRGCDVIVYPMVGIAQEDDFKAYTVVPFVLGRLGFLLKDMRQRGVRDVVLIGALTRPDLSALRPDWGLIRHFFELLRVLRKGDDHVLKGVVGFLERQGFRVWGASMLAPDLTAPCDVLGRIKPDKVSLADIAYGVDLLQTLSPFDVGQAVIVADGRAIAVEAVEGTNQMIARIADLKKSGRLKLRDGCGVLIKIPKIGQDLRVDMPAVGEETIRQIKAAGLAGLAVQAGGVLMAERDAMIRLADDAGVFIVGVNVSE